MERRQLGRAVAGAVVGLVVVVALLFLLGVIGVPDAGIEDNAWGEVEDGRIEILTTVWIDNPNPFSVGNDSDVEYDVELAGVPITEGNVGGVDVPSGRSTETFSAEFDSRQIAPWWRRHVANDEVSTAVVKATIHTSVGPGSVSRSDSYEHEIETDIEGALDRSFSQFEGTYSASADDVGGPDWLGIEPTVEVEDVTTNWGTVTEDSTEMVVTVRIHNPNIYPIPVPGFTGSVEFNGVPVADWGAGEVELRDLADDALIGGGESQERVFLIAMDNRNLAEWFGTHVDNGEETRVVVTGQFALTVRDVTVGIPPGDAGVTCEFDLTTAIFVDQEEGVSFDECR